MPSSDRPFNIVSVQKAQIGAQTSVSLGEHLVIQLVNREKYGLDPGCHVGPRKASHAISEAQLAGCLKRLAGGRLERNVGI